MIFVSADVHGAANDARITGHIGGGGDASVISSIDARGVGLQLKITASRIYKSGVVGDVADARQLQRHRATIIHGGRYSELKKIVRTGRGFITINNAIGNE